MENTVQVPDYVKNLLQPNDARNTAPKKVWGIDLENVWVPFFTASNVTGATEVPSEDLGAPLRLSKSKDGSVRFSTSGRPSTRVAPELSKNIKMVQQNFIAGLVSFAGQVMEEHADQYAAEVTKAQEAATPILETEQRELAEAERLMLEAAKAQAEAHGESLGEQPAEAQAEPNHDSEPSEPTAEVEQTTGRGQRRQAASTAA